jgi:hypothetical protein
MNGAGPALRDPATKFRTNKAEFISEYPQKRHLWIDIDFKLPSIYVELIFSHKRPAPYIGCRLTTSVSGWYIDGKQPTTAETHTSATPCRSLLKHFEQF